MDLAAQPRWRKRLDRLGQMATLTAITVGSRHLIELLARATGKANTTVTTTLLGGLAAITLMKKVAIFCVPGLAPADVLNKSKVK